MENKEKYIQLVKQDQSSDEESKSRLAEAARMRLREYLQRLTFKKDLTE